MKVFEQRYIKQCIGIKWWERILLWFCKPISGYDFGYKDKTVGIIAKRLFGKYYIVKEKV